MSEFVSVPLEEARTGDHLLQAGTWHEVADATFPTDGMVTIWWNGGGSMTFPIAHRTPLRRLVS